MSLFELKKVVVGPETLCATVQLDAAAPVMTSDDIEATQRVYDLMPQIADHACISEAGDVFRDALPNTECAHLLEHVCVELMSRLDLGGRGLERRLDHGVGVHGRPGRQA